MEYNGSTWYFPKVYFGFVHSIDSSYCSDREALGLKSELRSVLISKSDTCDIPNGIFRLHS